MTSLRQYFHIPQTTDEPELFKKMISFSIILHVILFVFFGVKASFFSNESIELDPTIRVDMVGLPDRLAKLPELPKPQEKPKAETKPEPKVEPKPISKPAEKPVVVLHPKHDVTKSIEKIREMEKAEKRKKALENIEKEVAAEERQAKVAQLLKGNAINSGSALHGLMKSEFNDYASEVHNHIHEHWNLPEWLSNDTLRATVVIFLDTQGNVVKRLLRKTSGDERFDNYALKAVDESSPFPKPPSKFIDLVKDDGIVIGFPQ